MSTAYKEAILSLSVLHLFEEICLHDQVRVLKTFVTQIQKYHPLMTALSEHKGGEEATSDSWNNGTMRSKQLDEKCIVFINCKLQKHKNDNEGILMKQH